MSEQRTNLSKQVSRVIINASVQEVWDALTQEGAVLPFFFGSVMHTTSLGPGAPIRMRSPNGKYTGVVGEILDFDPPHRYSMTFKFTHLNDALCKVIYELKKVPEGTEFTLTSDEMPAGTKTEKSMQQGGKFITSELKRWVETGRPSMMARFIMLMNRLFSFATPKQSLSEKWPLDEKVT